MKYAKLVPHAIPPFRKNPTDGGMDFFSCENTEVSANSMSIVHTGISVEIPEGYILLLKPKSKNNHLIAAGIIDAHYEPGEVLVKITNITSYTLYIKKGDPICQGVYIKVETPSLVEVSLDQLISDNPRSGKGGIVEQAKNK